MATNLPSTIPLPSTEVLSSGDDLEADLDGLPLDEYETSDKSYSEVPSYYDLPPLDEYEASYDSYSEMPDFGL